MPPTNNTTTGCRDIPFFRKLTLALVLVFVVLMAIISIAWLAMHPHDPGFGVTSLSVTNFTVSGSRVRGRYEVGLNITNPNKIQTQVVLRRVGVLVLHDQEWRSVVVAVQPRTVFLEKKTNMSVKVDLEVRDSRKKVVPEVDLVNDWKKGVVNFNVVLSVEVRFEAGILPSKDKLLCVRCMDLDVGFLSPRKDTGKLLGIGKGCNTEMLQERHD
ncbi:hypothetical protein E2542_SST09918 [Spatholobus suberectus]|nr:hypothetical protein E2542_SST09918 [Spatholobus suberectus]